MSKEAAGALRPPGVRGWLRLRPDTPESVAGEVEEEIALHMELRVRELVSRGFAEEEARAEAVRRFGEIQRARLVLQRAATERERRMSLREWLAGWAQDFRYSGRALWRERPLALVIVLTLALGLGANTIMFGIVDHLLLRGPSHVEAPEHVRRVYETAEQWTGYGTESQTGYITYTLLRDRTTSFEGVAAYRSSEGRIGTGLAGRDVPVGWSTADMFPLLGVEPHLGRFYTAAEDRANDPASVAVLDYGFWHSEYGGASDVLGRMIMVNDVAYTIIGVGPPGFTGPELARVSVWLPMSTGHRPTREWTTTWSATWLQVIARVRPDIPIGTAAADATAAYRASAEAAMGVGFSASAAEGTLSLLPLHYGPAGEEPAEASVARWLLGVSVVVLLIAVANVANLLLARMLRRRREVAVRLALGISRARLVRLLLTESLLLAATGLAGALVLANWGAHAVRIALLPDVQWGAPLSGRTVLFAGGVSVLTGLLIALAPALHSRRPDLTRGLRTGAAETGGRRAGARAALTVVQAAFSLVLLVGAGLFVRSLWNVSRLDLGIDADRIVTAEARMAPPPGPEDASDAARSAWLAALSEQQAAFLREAIGDLNGRPEVESAALAMGTPLQGGFGVRLSVPGRDSIPRLPGGGPYITAATPSYFATVGTEIMRGRGFETGAGAGTEPVVVVNETMAATLWPGEDALTKCLIVGATDAPCARVVGIAEDAHRSGIREEVTMQYYIPLGQERGICCAELVVRPRGPAKAFAQELRRIVHGLDPRVVDVRVASLQAVLDPQIRPWRMGATMFMIFGALALLIAAVGLYSVMAYGVTQRRAEIGVRMALGARTSGIVGMIVRQGVALVLIGIGIGAVLALASGHLIEPLLFETDGRDVLVIGIAAAVLSIAAVLASIVPAMRAGRTDPLSALRTD